MPLLCKGNINCNMNTVLKWNTEFSWFAFSCIRTEYGEIFRISPYLVRMRKNTGQKKLRIWTIFAQSSYFYVDSIVKCWQLGTIMASQHNEWCHKIASFPAQKIFWISISCKMTSQKRWYHQKKIYVSRNDLSVTWH